MLSSFPPGFPPLPPTKFKSKIMSPLLCFPPIEISKFGFPLFLWMSLLIYNIQASPYPKFLKDFKKFLTSYTGSKLTTNSLSTCVTSCNTQEPKQVRRRKLIFQIHKQTHSVHNHILNFRK